MALQFAPTSEEQLPQIMALFEQAFHPASGSPLLDRNLLRWKYYAPGPSIGGSRSYALIDGGRMLAHAAVWPLSLRTDSGLRPGIGFGDWAATEEQRGVGLMLLKKLMTLGSFILVIGGAEITRQILPRFGFAPWASLPVFAKVLRPFAQARRRPSTLGWKEPARIGRNLMWSFASAASTGEWSAHYAPPDQPVLSLVEAQTGSLASKELIEFLEHCPNAEVRFVAVKQGDRPAGYAVVSIVHGQGRIADIRIASAAPAAWASAISVTTALLAKRKDICEVSALTSVGVVEDALAANGFQIRDRRPLVIYDPEKRMAGEPVPPLGMLVDDAVYLEMPDAPFLT